MIPHDRSFPDHWFLGLNVFGGVTGLGSYTAFGGCKKLCLHSNVFHGSGAEPLHPLSGFPLPLSTEMTKRLYNATLSTCNQFREFDLLTAFWHKSSAASIQLLPSEWPSTKVLLFVQIVLDAVFNSIISICFGRGKRTVLPT